MNDDPAVASLCALCKPSHQLSVHHKFALGRIVATPGALLTLIALDSSPLSLLGRHVQGDWGDVCAEDRQVNEDAVLQGWRILSSYAILVPGEADKSVKVWVITEADRSVTTVLLPSEY